MTLRQSVILALLAVAVLINYVDRGILSVAADPLSRELGIGPAKIGMMLSAFFWTYAFCQFAAGWLMDKLTVRWAYAGGYFLWSTATALTGLAPGFAPLFAARLVLGAGESISYPATSEVLARFPDRHRGFANAAVDAGSKSGAALGVLVGGWLIAQFGWRGMFLAVGLCSLLWLLPWVLSTRGLDVRRPMARTDPGAGPTTLDILKRREAWGTIIGLFACNYAGYFMITWLPLYFARERHYSMEEVALYGSLPFWCTAVSSVFSGWLSDRLVSWGLPFSPVRRSFAAVGLWGTTLLVPAALVESQRASFVLIVAACIFFGMFTSHIWLIAQTLAGPEAAGRWTGTQNAFGNMAGVVAPMLTGFLVQITGTFAAAFAAVGLVLLLGGAAQLWVVGEVRPLTWNFEKKQAPVDLAPTR